MIRCFCDAPDCARECEAIRVDALGRLHLPKPWVVYGGDSRSRTLVVCRAEHVIPASAAPRKPLESGGTEPNS